MPSLLALSLVFGLFQLAPDEDPGVRVEALLDEEDALADRLDALDRQIAGLSTQQAEHEATLAAAAERAAAIDRELAVLSLRATTQRARLTRRLRARQHLDATAWLQVMLKSTSPDELVRHRHYLDRILGADLVLLAEIKADRALQALLGAEREAAVEAARQASEGIDLRRANLEADRAVRTELLRRLRTERRLMRRLMANQAAQRAQLDGLFEGDPSAPVGLEGHFEEEYGRLPRPVPGPIIGRFGDRGEDDAPAPGIRIRATAGLPVRAVYSGRVVFAGWHAGQGNLLILDHGDGYHTSYAHLGRLALAQEAIVAQGEVLGSVGDTGSLDGVQLAFEVRVQGKAEDPLRWLRN